MGVWAVRLAYGFMIVGIVLCFVFSRGHEKDIRLEADVFARCFARLSNYLSPTPPKERLRVTRLPDGGLAPLPAGQQPEAFRFLFRRAASQRAEEEFAALDAAAAQLAKRAGFNRTHKAQFCAPADELLLLTQSFLRDCGDLQRLDTPEKLRRFESYLYEQPRHRTVLLKRISAAFAEEYRGLNRAYQAEMERLENEEKKARQEKKRQP